MSIKKKKKKFNSIVIVITIGILLFIIGMFLQARIGFIVTQLGALFAFTGIAYWTHQREFKSKTTKKVVTAFLDIFVTCIIATTIVSFLAFLRK